MDHHFFIGILTCLWIFDKVVYKEQDMVEPIDPAQPFELQDYYAHGERYQSRFAPHLPLLTVLVNGTYWDERYPRLVTKDRLRAMWSHEATPRLRVIGDLGCDIEGAIECTLKCTEPSDPVYVYDPVDGTIVSGVDGKGPVVLAVDILPAELPREASEAFSSGERARFLPEVGTSMPGRRFVAIPSATLSRLSNEPLEIQEAAVSS